MSAEVNPEDTITTVKLNIVVNAAEVRLKENTPCTICSCCSSKDF